MVDEQPLMSFWTKVVRPDGSVLLRPGRLLVAADEIGTAEAAKVLGVCQRRVQMLCDQGVLVEGRDWRKNPSATDKGSYRIKREAVLKLRMGI